MWKVEGHKIKSDSFVTKIVIHKQNSWKIHVERYNTSHFSSHNLKFVLNKITFRILRWYMGPDRLNKTNTVELFAFATVFNGWLLSHKQEKCEEKLCAIYMFLAGRH